MTRYLLPLLMLACGGASDPPPPATDAGADAVDVQIVVDSAPDADLDAGAGACPINYDPAVSVCVDTCNGNIVPCPVED